MLREAGQQREEIVKRAFEDAEQVRANLIEQMRERTAGRLAYIEYRTGEREL